MKKKCFSDPVSFSWNAGTPERSKSSSPFRRSGVPEEAQGSQSSTFQRSTVPGEAHGSLSTKFKIDSQFYTFCISRSTVPVESESGASAPRPFPAISN